MAPAPPQNLNVGAFVSPLNQFESGETAYACVEYGVADIYYSGPTGGEPTGTAEDVDNMADKWYQEFNKSILASNTAGTSLSQEWAMLSGVGLHWQQIPADVVAVKLWLGNGLPVLICGSETGFFDVQLGRVPYAWTPSGNHCLVACGITPGGNLLVRDYANVEASPGSIREYASADMALVSATAVYPRWYVPPVDSAWLNSAQLAAATALWNSTGLKLSWDTGIGKSWQANYRDGRYFGPPLSKEIPTTDWNGHPLILQVFQEGVANFLSSDETCSWYGVGGILASK